MSLPVSVRAISASMCRAIRRLSRATCREPRRAGGGKLSLQHRQARRLDGYSGQPGELSGPDGGRPEVKVDFSQTRLARQL